MSTANLVNEKLNRELEALAGQAPADGVLAAARAVNLARLKALPLPLKFSETWKYTKLTVLDNGYLRAVSPAAASPADLPDFGMPRLVIVNGRLPASLPAVAGIGLTPLADAQLLGLANTTFAYLNGATLDEGLHIRVAKNVQPGTPLHILFHSTGGAPAHHNTRLVVELEAGSRLELVEHYTGTGQVLSNSVTEIRVHDNAELVHCRLQSEAPETLHIGQLAIAVARNARARSWQFMQASTLKRNNVNVTLTGPGAELSMNGAFIARGRSHVDNQLCVEHLAPQCTSNQSYRGIAGDEGHIIFNGRIHIPPGASKTNANLTNKNLLLSTGAEIDSKPELEIYNDDVKCSHGTTIGQIDAGMRFYLQSRGIDEATAQRMLSLGFIQEELASLPFATVADWVSNWLGRVATEAR